MFFTYQAMPNRAGGGTDYKYPRLVTIDNGYGATLTYTYETDGRASDSWYSYRVKQVDVNSGMGLATEMKYVYQTPVYTGLNGNPNLGELIGYTYSTETTADYNNGNASILDIKHNFGTTGLDKGREYSTEWLVGGASMRKVVNTYVTDNSKAPFIGWNYRYLSQVENFEKIGSSLSLTSKAIFRRDPETGNLLLQEDYLGSSLYRKTYYEYSVNTAPSVYILNTVSRKVLVDSSYLIYSDSRYHYDDMLGSYPTKGELTLTQTLSGVANNTVDMKYVYDEYGNVTHVYRFDDWGEINQLPSSDPIGTETEFDGTLHTYPVSVINPLEQTSSTEYLFSLGIPFQVTDPNGWTTLTSYDGLGRTLSVTPPGLSDPGVVYSYPAPAQNGRISAPYAIEMQILDDPAGIYRSVWGFYDGLGRILQNQVYNADNGKLLLTEVSFNPQGLTLRQSDPHEANWPGGQYMNPAWTAGTFSSYLYDGLGRNTKVTTSAGLFTETSYSGLTTTVKDPNGNLRSNTVDGLGRLIRVGEYNGTTLYATTQYGYNIADQLIKVTDANSNITTIQYNRLGQKTSMDDPDMGNWTYDYYPSGTLKLQEDARGLKLSFVYDELNRLVDKNDYLTAANLAHYEYGDVVGSIGMRTYMSDTSGSVRWGYEDFGRTVIETRTIDSTEKTSTSSSDWLGRVLAVSYPDGESLTYHYDALGRPDHLTSDESTLVDLAYNVLGQITSTQLGNGVTVTNDYPLQPAIGEPCCHR